MRDTTLQVVADSLSRECHVRIFCLVEVFTRAALAILVVTSIYGQRMACELNVLAASRGRPWTIASDSGTETTSRTMLEGTNRADVDWEFIAPDKPQRNESAENVNCTLREE